MNTNSNPGEIPFNDPFHFLGEAGPINQVNLDLADQESKFRLQGEYLNTEPTVFVISLVERTNRGTDRISLELPIMNVHRDNQGKFKTIGELVENYVFDMTLSSWEALIDYLVAPATNNLLLSLSLEEKRIFIKAFVELSRKGKNPKFDYLEIFEMSRGMHLPEVIDKGPNAELEVGRVLPHDKRTTYENPDYPYDTDGGEG